MFYTIYKITNILDNRIYIGKHQTKDLNDGYMGSGKRLKRAIEKYGIENFKKEILFHFDNEFDMNEKEKELVTEEFVKEDTNYNLCPGGDGGWGYVNANVLVNEKRISVNRENIKKALSPEARMKAAEKLRKHWDNFSWSNFSPEQKHIANVKRANTHRGMMRSDITKERMSDSHRGEKNSQYGTMWITNGQENKKIKKDIDIIPDGWYKGRK